MTQNIYDDPGFFAGYSQLPRSVHGLEAAPEWPTLQAQLPDLKGLRVLDLGCGFGWFCRWAAQQGAASVHGVDVSERMLDRARGETAEPVVTYARADLEGFEIAPGSIDLAYSSLAFHYLETLGGLLKTVQAALVPGGRIVFSVEHPILTAPSPAGWTESAAGGPVWPVNRYLAEGPRSTDWLAEGVVKQHRTIGTYIRLLTEAGFTLRWLEEWGPSAAQIAEHPDWAKERERPAFLLIAADRP
ncbi:MAG: class I SAM-dependent methyltransferase [Alphaproteobacteria bacterium]|nr:class I SAM-dependent methyltransferase [Alphaproteobacteria bacterium]MBU0796167.1 class I SAM-dependent methyltransferase [Alphaproteobacteria bacterium]MBU0888042.1 class I SAM-dependent methyltransferase [Alphaproteobacteria bacterium]MBU1812999.1 class I SAM-dependent methyltransferase [Alphaproteobacteria bacterium]MBU2089370.1 class I SAM-dependent methyltransferase [Alphaproteobacteria bacterium]